MEADATYLPFKSLNMPEEILWILLIEVAANMPEKIMCKMYWRCHSGATQICKLQQHRDQKEKEQKKKYDPTGSYLQTPEEPKQLMKSKHDHLLLTVHFTVCAHNELREPELHMLVWMEQNGRRKHVGFPSLVVKALLIRYAHP